MHAIALRWGLHPGRLSAFGLALAALLLPGCGKNRVVLDVDVRSFMNESDVTQAYLAPPGTPFTLQLDPVAINLVEGYKDFGTADEVSIDMSLLYDNRSGQGQATFTLYFGSDAASTFSTTPVATIDASLASGTQTTGQTHFKADQRVLDLFTSKQMWMGVKITWEPQSTQVLAGSYTITALDAHVVSTLDLFQ